MTVKIDNPKIGLTGEYRPRMTISGRPCNVIVTRAGLGHGYYCVIDMFPTVDVKAEVEQLRKEVANATSVSTKRRKKSDDTE